MWISLILYRCLMIVLIRLWFKSVVIAFQQMPKISLQTAVHSRILLQREPLSRFPFEVGLPAVAATSRNYDFYEIEYPHTARLLSRDQLGGLGFSYFIRAIKNTYGKLMIQSSRLVS